MREEVLMRLELVAAQQTGIRKSLPLVLHTLGKNGRNLTRMVHFTTPICSLIGLKLQGGHWESWLPLPGADVTPTPNIALVLRGVEVSKFNS